MALDISEEIPIYSNSEAMVWYLLNRNIRFMPRFVAEVRDVENALEEIPVASGSYIIWFDDPILNYKEFLATPEELMTVLYLKEIHSQPFGRIFIVH